MSGLAGDFGTMPLKDLAVYLWNRQATGTLTLEREGTRKSVTLEGGYVINAYSNLPREYLGQFLINLGHISEEQFNRAFETQKETKVFLGRILVMIGLVSEPVVNTVLALKFRETLLEAFDWPENATFTFEKTFAKVTENMMNVKVALIDIHKESDFRLQAWEQFRAAFPSGGCTLELVRENLVDEPKPGSIDAKIVVGIEAGQTLDELALGLHATDYFLFQRLYALHTLGAIVVHPPDTNPPIEIDIDVDLGLGDSPSAESMLGNARVFFAQGNHRDSWSLARRSHSMVATLETTLLLKQIEAAWLPQLRADLLSKRRVPATVIEAEKLKALPLAAPERYLLSRVDGKREIDAIIRVAPLREFEALTFFDRFAAQGWIKLS
jgi:hypothetical protein